MTGPTLEVRAAGDRALLVTPDDADLLTGLAEAMRALAPAGVVDIVVAATTLLVTTTGAPGPAIDHALTEALAMAGGPDRARAGDATARREQRAGGTPVEIPVRYDGVDLVEAAALSGRSPAELVAAHTGQLWRCAFVGFAPGFGYLAPTETEIVVPRRAQSRSAVPAGSVALADGFTAVYPRRTPGGWQLIGSTTAPMWDVDRLEPALVTAGRLVRFVEAVP